MAITFEQISEVNSKINKLPIKGKEYALVNSRVMAFRELYPEGKISTEIITMADGMVVMQAIVSDQDGRILSTGLAYEREGSTYINKTSYIENCETSAVGRALGFLGLGVDDSIASAEELVNAVTNQKKDENGDPVPMISEKQLGFMKKLASDQGRQTYVMKRVQEFGKKSMTELTMHEATDIIGELKKWNAEQS